MRLLSQYFEPLERFEEHNIEDTILVLDSSRIKSREQAEVMVVAARQTEGLEAAEKACTCRAIARMRGSLPIVGFYG